MSERKYYSRQISKSPRVPKHPIQSLHKRPDTSNSNARDTIPSSARTFNLSLDTCHGCYFPEPRPTPEYRISSAPPNFPFPSPKKDTKGEKSYKSERRKLKDLSLRNGFLMNEKFLKNPAHYTSDFQKRKTSELQIPDEFYVLPNEHEFHQIKASRFYFSRFKNKGIDGVEKAARIGENAPIKKKADKGALSTEKDHVKKTKNASESVKSSTHKEPSEKNKKKSFWIYSNQNGLYPRNILSSQKSYFPKHQKTPAPDSGKLPKKTPVDRRLINTPPLKKDYDHQPLTVSGEKTYYKIEPTSIHVHTQNKALDNKNSYESGTGFKSLFVRDLSATQNTANNKVSHTNYASRALEIEPKHPQRPDLDKETRQLLAADPEVENNEYPENFIKTIRKHLRRSFQQTRLPGDPQLPENNSENFIEADYFSRQYKRKRKSRQRYASKDTKSLETEFLLESINETDDTIENKVPSASIVPASTNRIPSTDHITPDNKTTNIPNQKPLNLQTNALPSTFPENEAYAQAKVKPTPYYKQNTALNQTSFNKRSNALPLKISGNQDPMQAKMKPGLEYKPTTDQYQKQHNMQSIASPQNISRNQGSERTNAKPNTAQNQKPLSILSNVTPSVAQKGQENAQTKIKQSQNQIPFNTQTNVISTNVPGNQDLTKTKVKSVTQFKANTAQNQKPLTIQSNVTPTALPGSQDNAQVKMKQAPGYKPSIAQNQNPPNAQTSIIPPNPPGSQDPTRMNIVPNNQFKPNIPQNQKPLPMQTNVTPSAAPGKQDNTRAKMKPASDYKSNLVTNQIPLNAQTSTLPSNFPKNQDPTQMPKKAVSEYGPAAGANQKSQGIPSNAYQSNIPENQDYTQAKMKPTTERIQNITPNQKPLGSSQPTALPRNQDPMQMQTKPASDYVQSTGLNQKHATIYQSNIPENQDYTQAKMKPTTERIQNITPNQKPYGTQGGAHPTSFPRNQDPTQTQTIPASDYVQSTGLNQKPASTYQSNIPENQDYTQGKMKPTTERVQNITPNQKPYGTQGGAHPTTFPRNQDPTQMQMKPASDYVPSTGLNQKSHNVPASTYQTNFPESQDQTQAKIKPTSELKQNVVPNQKSHSIQGSAHQPSFPENQYSAKGRMKPASEYKPNIAEIQNSYNAQANAYPPNLPASQEPLKSSLKHSSQIKPNTAQGQKPLQSGGFPLTFSPGPEYVNPNEKHESLSGPASKNFPVMPDKKASAYGQKLFDKQGLELKPIIVDRNTKEQFFENRESFLRTSKVYEKHAHSDSSNTPKSLSFQSDNSSPNPSQCSKCSSNKDAVKKLGLFSDTQPLFPENIKILSSKTSIRPDITNVEPTKRPQISKDKSYFPHYQRLANIPDITSNQKPTYNKTTNEIPAATPIPSWRNRVVDSIEKDSQYQGNMPLQPQTANAEPPQKTQVAEERHESTKPNFPTSRKATDPKSKSDVPTKKKNFDKEVLKLNSSKSGRQNVMFQLSKNAEGNHHENVKVLGPENNQKPELFSKAQPKNFNVYTVEYNDPNKALVRSIGTSLNGNQLGGQNLGFSAQRSKFIDTNAGLQNSEYREIGSRRGSRLFVETGLPLFKPSQKSTNAQSFSKTDFRNVVIYPFEYDDQNNALVQKMSDALRQRRVDKVNILASVPNANFINPNVGFQLLNPEYGSQIGSTLFLESELPILITPEQSRNAGFFSNTDPQTYGAYYIEYDGRNNVLSPISSFYQTFYDQPDFELNAANRIYLNPNEAYINPNESYINPNEAYVKPNEAYVSPKETYINPNEAYVSPNEAYVSPNEAYVNPNEAYASPNEAYVSLNKAYDSPNEAYVSPNEAYDSSNEAYVNPNEAYDSPNEAYVSPNEAYVSSNEAYDSPNEAYVNANEAYINPNEAYVSPNEAYDSSNEAYASPNEAYDSSNEAYASPNEAYDSPNEAYGSPNEAYVSPNEAYDSPNKAYVNPNEAYDSSNEAYDSSNEAYASPNEAYVSPNKAHVSPNEAYDSSNEAYDSSNEAYASPNEAYVSPNKAYDSPNKAYVNPNEAHASPSEAYASPNEAYVSPNEVYASPNEAYVNPNEAYISPNEAYITPNEAYTLPGSQTSLEIITLSAWHPSRRVQSSETESLSPYNENENSLGSTTATPLSLSSFGSQDLDHVAFSDRFGIEDSDSSSFGSSQSDFQDNSTGFSQSDFLTSDDLENSTGDGSALETESENLQPYPFGYSGPYGALSDEFSTNFCQKLSGTQVLECEVPELLFSGTESGSLLSEKSYYTLSSETLIPEPPLPIFDVPQTQKHSEFFGHNADFGSPGMQSQEHCSSLESSTFSSSRSSPDPYANSPTQTSVSTCFAPQNPYGMANQTFYMNQSSGSSGTQSHPNTPVGRAFCPGRFTSAPEVPMNQSYVLPNTGGHPSHLNQSYVVDQNRSSPGGPFNQTFGVGNSTGSPCPPQNQSYVVNQNTGSPCVAANQTFGVGNNTGSPRSPAHQTFEIGQSYSSPCALLNQTFNPGPTGNPCPTLNQTFAAGSASGSPHPNQTFAYSPHHNVNQTYGSGNTSGNPCANQTYGVCGPAQQTSPGMQRDGAMVDPNRTVNISQPFMNRMGSPSPVGGPGPIIDPTRTYDLPMHKLPYKTPNFIRVERKRKECSLNASDLDSTDPDPYSPESGVDYFTPDRKYQTSFMNSRQPCGNTTYYPSVSSSPNESPVRASTFCIEYKDPYQSTPRSSMGAQNKNRFQPVGEDTGDDDLILDIISHHLSKLSTPTKGICTGRQEKSKCLPKEPPKKSPPRGRTLPKMPELTDEDICNLIQCEKDDVNSVSYLMSDARKVYKKPCPKQQKAQMSVQNIAKSITSRPTTSQSHAPDYGKSQASAIEPDPEDISPDLAANMMFSQEEGIELEGPPTKTVNYLFPESKDSDQDKIAVAGSEPNEEENMVEKSPDVPEEGVSDSAYAKTMMIKGGRSKGPSYEMDVALGHEKREYVLVPKKPIRYNKIQYRGNLPTWFPGYFSSFPDDHGGLKLVSSPSQLLQKAWMWTAPLNLPPSDIIILD